MTGIDIASVFREAIAQGVVRASAEQWKIINSILLCRTPALGGHLYECTGCQRERPVYNSCMNRHCPKCQGGATAKWLEARAKELLNVPYFHLVFTIPHELGFAALTNKAVFYDILFQASATALKQVAERAHGGHIGFFSVLHTWTQTLELHPHIHSVVPGVIVTRDGSARRTRNNYFVSRRRLATVFRAVFLRMIRRRADTGALKFPDDEAREAFYDVLPILAREDWVCYAKKPFHSPECVLKYLSLYTHKIGISPSRLVSFDARSVSFTCRDRKKDHEKRTVILPLAEFVRRFLLHTLPPQFVRIRHYGFLANGVRTKSLLRLRATLGERPFETSPSVSAACPHCGCSTFKYKSDIAPVRPTGSMARKTKLLPLSP